MTIKAVLFDLEGTLVDFQWKLAAAGQEIKNILAGEGLDLSRYPENPDYASLLNTTVHLISGWPAEKRKKVFDRLEPVYDYYDTDALSRWQPYDDTLSTLKFLHKKKYRMGIVSNCGRKASSGVLEKFDLLSFFELIISRNDVSCVKPDPEGLIKASQIMGTEYPEMIFIGDSVNDIIPADEIGMPSCFLGCGESNVTNDRPSSATYTIRTLSELIPIIGSDESGK